MELTAILEALVTTGATSEQLIAAARAFEAERERVAAAKRKAQATRMAEYRAKKAAPVADVAATSVTDPPLINLKKEVPPSPPKGGSVPQGRPTRGSRLPDDWKPSEELLAFANREGFNVPDAERDLMKFANHFHAASGAKGVKVDWEKTAKNWLLRSADERRSRGPPRLAYSNDRPRPKSALEEMTDAAQRYLNRYASE
jgi:hypothetical protein